VPKSGRSEAARSRREGDGRGRFERFVEVVHRLVSAAPFFYVIVAVLVVWAASMPLWSSATKWELALHTGSSVLSLLLLVLLQNAGRRSEEASQEKLNVIAEALSDLMASRARDDEDLEESVRRLRQAVGLEGRH
jgi:low affinity Fe/Cu permease